MSGVHADRGDKTHRLVSGEAVVEGLRVFTNNLDSGVITKVEGTGDCGWYCNAWHTVTLDTTFRGEPMTGTASMNCERLATSFEGRAA